MADYPYVLNYGKTPQLFDRIRDMGTPKKVTNAWLASAGFKSKNDRPFIGMLKFIGLLQDDGTPNSAYNLMKGANWQNHLANVIQSAYEPVFRTYSNAQSRSQQELIDLFRSHDTSPSSTIISKKVATFQKLCSIADFSGSDHSPAPAGDQKQEEDPQAPQSHSTSDVVISAGARQQGLSVTINITLEIPATTNAEVYDKLFESMSRHLRMLDQH